MSNAGKREDPILGEWTDPRTPSPEDQAILDKVKEQFERRRNSLVPTSKFLALLVRILRLCGGTHYLFLVDIGESTNICLYVILPVYAVPDPEPILEKILPAEKIYEKPLIIKKGDANDTRE
ncbi:uncharacterized protein LOC143981668 [Lithobates pipiens]